MYLSVSRWSSQGGTVDVATPPESTLGNVMMESEKLARFERLMLPHLDAAHNLARWLLRSPSESEDAVQEAYLRAFRFFDGFDGGDGRAWMLAIVRNVCRSSMQTRGAETWDEFDEQRHGSEYTEQGPEDSMLRQARIDSVRQCIAALPHEYRVVVVMRELEQMSYKEVGAAITAPLGTVMSRLARARARLQQCLSVRVRGARI